ncbi:hypothetical protein RvY_05263 [Ramazzottius varieornatus]|uniref:Uncharacterized protein n=1 Tax=Ramazzottius varieornatus TaxID=947166 RepID=A0A1D1UXJ3_RAMVA|nr:hypothetical protein RvY_05263 [Ramazzottius varieornatus]
MLLFAISALLWFNKLFCSDNSVLLHCIPKELFSNVLFYPFCSALFLFFSLIRSCSKGIYSLQHFAFHITL